jgi:hypothetical protein
VYFWPLTGCSSHQIPRWPLRRSVAKIYHYSLDNFSDLCYAPASKMEQQLWRLLPDPLFFWSQRFWPPLGSERMNVTTPGFFKFLCFLCPFWFV